MNNTQLLKCGEFVSGKIKVSDLSLSNYISTENMLPNKKGIVKSNNLPPAKIVNSFKKDDILISNIRPYFKKIWLAQSVGGCSADILTFKVNNKFNPLFIYYCLSQDSFFKHMMAGAKGSKMPRGDKEQILKFNVPNYNVDKQNKISMFLKSIDNKIDINNKINNELETMAKTLYDYWFVQCDFPNDEGNPYKSTGGEMIWNDIINREIPESWEVKRFREIFAFSKGKIPEALFDKKSDERIDYITIDVLNEGIPEYCRESAATITEGDVLMVMDGAASCDIYQGFNGAIGSTLSALKIVNKSVSNEFLYFMMKRYENIFKKVNTGSTVPHANKNYICDYYVTLPKRAKLNQLEAIFIITRKIIVSKLKENQNLISFREFILPLLMNGQVGFK